MPLPRKPLACLAILAFLGLAGCVNTVLPKPGDTGTDPSAGDADVLPSPASRAMAAHYQRVQNDLLAQGLLRTDSGGADVPFNSRQLTENFVKIALYDEYVSGSGGLVARQTESRLRRWEQPVRMRVEFGASIPRAQRLQDRAAVAAYTARLSRATGLSVRMTEGEANYNVFFLNEDERQAFGPTLAALVPGIEPAAIRAITNMDRSTLCIVFAFSEPGSAVYSRAVAVIRGEHPDLLRRSCIHEELAQGMGLANDSPQARPSIFNDDEEFALLTRHDELLLRILYDRRLSPGMTPATARPIVRQIAEEMIGGES